MKTVLLSSLLLLAIAVPRAAWRKLLRAPGGWKGKVPTEEMRAFGRAVHG